MNILVIYAHPSNESFTYLAKEAFINGAKDAGHNVEISDLYKEHFNPVMSESEYLREGFYNDTLALSQDVIEEQEKINRADYITFIFPNFWTSSPAILEGWFQRVWTYGFAYGNRKMKILDKAVFIMIMGGNQDEEIRKEQICAIKTTMIGDRINDRARKSQFFVFDKMTRGYGNNENRKKNIKDYCEEIYQIGLNI